MTLAAQGTPLEEVIQNYQLTDMHLSASEEVSPWVFVEGSEGLWARYLLFDLRIGQWHAMVRSDGPASLGRHKHRSPVTGLTIKGSWGYREYDWVARPGDLVQEYPGTIHNLYTDDPDGMLTYFVINGAIEYYDDADNIVFLEGSYSPGM
jgi:hypothetical protein